MQLTCFKWSVKSLKKKVDDKNNNNNNFNSKMRFIECLKLMPSWSTTKIPDFKYNYTPKCIVQIKIILFILAMHIFIHQNVLFRYRWYYLNKQCTYLYTKMYNSDKDNIIHISNAHIYTPKWIVQYSNQQCTHLKIQHV